MMHGQKNIKSDIILLDFFVTFDEEWVLQKEIWIN